MEQQGILLSGSLASDAHYSSVTGGCRMLPTKRYIDGTLPTYVDQSSALCHISDTSIRSRVDNRSIVANAEPSVAGSCDSTSNQGGPISMRTECQSGSSCCTSSSVVEKSRLSASTDSVDIGADSTGVTAEVTDGRSKLAEIRSERHPTRCKSDVSADVFDGDLQPFGDSSVCSVCGDVAAGFHCGAYVCEACKVQIFLNILSSLL